MVIRRIAGFIFLMVGAGVFAFQGGRDSIGREPSAQPAHTQRRRAHDLGAGRLRPARLQPDRGDATTGQPIALSSLMCQRLSRVGSASGGAGRDRRAQKGRQLGLRCPAGALRNGLRGFFKLF